MEGNKEDALKCLRIGKEALESGDRTRALKYLNKVRRFDPSLPIDDLLYTAEESNHSPRTELESPSFGSLSSSAPSSSTTRARVSSKGSSKDYTEEQLTIVHQIKKQKDYYQILGLERSCSVEDVRRAYRKLSLKVHPDKNKAPGLKRRFSDDETKKRYDLVGSEEPNYGRAAATHHHSHGFSGFYDDQFDPDEIFRSFFGGGFDRGQAATPFGTFYFRTGGMAVPNGNGSTNGGLRPLLQMLPIILLIVLNFLPLSDPIYTLSRNHPYEYKLETPKGVAYFVRRLAKFEQDYPYNSVERMDLERRVERDYVGIVSQNCRVEMQRRQWGVVTEMPHCNMLEKYRTASA